MTSQEWLETWYLAHTLPPPTQYWQAQRQFRCGRKEECPELGGKEHCCGREWAGCQATATGLAGAGLSEQV